MILNYKNILFLGILLFSILYSLLYILRDIYFATQNFQIKKYINKVLPFLTKYNIFFLIITLIILIIEFYNMYIPKFSFFIIIGCIILNFLLVYIPIRFTNNGVMLSQFRDLMCTSIGFLLGEAKIKSKN